MPASTIPYQETGYFSKTICDYLSEKESIRPFYEAFPSLEALKKQATIKGNLFPSENRKVLVERLEDQFKNDTLSEATQTNIKSLLDVNTFTITTGHQLNLFTGPLYFLYKIFSVINLTEKLNQEDAANHYVPVYWMATEDHDFDEINYFNLYGKKLRWNRTDGGAVGELSTEGLDEVLSVFKSELNGGIQAERLSHLFSEAYLKHDNLTDATRYLGNELFAAYGLVIVDGNDSELKKLFTPYVERELKEQISHKMISETTKQLVEAGYKEQVHPREINLFYLTKGVRERIVQEDNQYLVNDTDVRFTREEILNELNTNTERFSPNALLRPLYQEVILPNLCYIGGGGELAYWFQLKDYFKEVGVPYPVLLLRNSVLLQTRKLSEKLERLEVEVASLFLDQTVLMATYTRQLSSINIDFSNQKQYLRDQFKDLYSLAKKTDPSFIGAVGAQEKKQIKGLENLERRLLKAEKRRLNDRIERLVYIQDKLFPKQSLQERAVNFSEFYLEYGDALLSQLKENLDPLANRFTILTL